VVEQKAVAISRQLGSKDVSAATKQHNNRETVGSSVFCAVHVERI
jgi:hypothetical protein